MKRHGFRIEFGKKDASSPAGDPQNENRPVPEESDIIAVQRKTEPAPPPIEPITAIKQVADILRNVRTMMGQGPLIFEKPPEQPVEKPYEFPEILLIMIPNKGEKFKKFLAAAECANLDELMEKFEAIARTENLNFDSNLSKDFWTIEISQKPDVKYVKAVDPKSVEFLVMFPYQKLSFTQRKV